MAVTVAHQARLTGSWIMGRKRPLAIHNRCQEWQPRSHHYWLLLCEGYWRCDPL